MANPLTCADLPQTFTDNEWDAAVREFTRWVDLHALTTADRYEVEQGLIDLLAEHPQVSVAHGIGPVRGLIRALGGTPVEGADKLTGIVSAYYYRPRYRADRRWSRAHDCEHGAPLNILGEAYYRV